MLVLLVNNFTKILCTIINKKSMKKIILIAGCLFAFNAFNAQEEPSTKTIHGKGEHNAEAKHPEKREKQTAEQRAQKTVNKINEVVSLTEAQKPKMYDFALTRAKGMEAVREKYKGQPDKKEALQAEITEIRKAFRVNAKAILTPEQLEKAKTTSENHKAEKAEKNKGTATDAVLDGKD